jgi:hypothetical protein
MDVCINTNTRFAETFGNDEIGRLPSNTLYGQQLID